MKTIIYRKSDLQCVGIIDENTTFEWQIEYNVIPNFGGIIEDYDSIETDKTNFHLEKDTNNIVIVVDNVIEPIIKATELELLENDLDEIYAQFLKMQGVAINV